MDKKPVKCLIEAVRRGEHDDNEVWFWMGKIQDGTPNSKYITWLKDRIYHYTDYTLPVKYLRKLGYHVE